MAQFCSGDKVRIKSLEEIARISEPARHGDFTLKGVGLLRFAMGEYCGQIATIRSKNADRAGGSASYWLQDFSYSWLEEWLEPYDVPPIDIDINTLL